MKEKAYENRLYKYRNHRFDAYWHELDRTRVDPKKCTRTEESPDLQGLARLIFFEGLLKKFVNPYRRKRLLKTIDENGEPTHSGYATLEIPYGERFTATRYVLSNQAKDCGPRQVALTDTHQSSQVCRTSLERAVRVWHR